MARKRTKQEALERLGDTMKRTNRPSRGFGKRAKIVHDAAYLGAAGLIMLDPFNRLADERIVLPLDMVCIPAYQAYMIQGSPSMQIYVRAGETIIPTGGNVEDVQQALDEAPAEALDAESVYGVSKGATAYQKRYRKNFALIAHRYKLKNGKWKKNGFKACVKKAHAMSKK